MMCEKLIIGTAQFGSDYGVANQRGKVACHEVERILDKAQSVGCRYLDTAAIYGDAEKLLGDIGVGDWNIISKVNVPKQVDCIASEFLQNAVEKSLDRLKVNKLFSILIHNTQELNEEALSCVLRQGEELKGKGLVDTIGLSVYPNAFPKIERMREFVSIIQAPFNPFDHRIRATKFNSPSHNFEFHARSIFLQGLLLMQSTQRPSYFNKWSKELSAWDSLVSNSSYSAQAICLNHALSADFINKVVIGVDGFDQFEELLTCYELFKDYIGCSFVSKELGLIDPFRWHQQ
jgi:aryl-alcohol dehydrogenase-like predicted oxidoreductase